MHKFNQSQLTSMGSERVLVFTAMLAFILIFVQCTNATRLGDLNKDNVVDVFDVVLISNAFGLSSGQTGFKPEADVTGDRIINIYDLVIVGWNFGNTYTHCNDGTVNNTCSSTKPKYCNSDFDLVNNCSVCGCVQGSFCNTDESCSSEPDIYAGIRCTTASGIQEESSDYISGATNFVASKFLDSSPSVIYGPGYIADNPAGTCYLNFPSPGGYYPNIQFASTDENEAHLNALDSIGAKVWLQVEPGYADIPTLIDLVLNQYGHHPSIIGFGVDVEWLENPRYREGRKVTDSEAVSWLNRVRSHNSNYKLFLKHWEPSMMPDIHPSGVVFISDSEQNGNFNNFLNGFIAWGQTFSNAEVGFQAGYPSDKVWWGSYNDPVSQIGNALMLNIPNMKYYYWVDFSIKDVYSGTVCQNGATTQCYTGSQGTEGVGECHGGTKTCSGSNWGSCVGQVIPQTETCDGKDNDCDGTTDEGCTTTRFWRIASYWAGSGISQEGYDTYNLFHHFNVEPQSGGYISNVNGLSEQETKAEINEIHAHGDKVVVVIGGWGYGSAFRSATNTVEKRQKFAEQIAARVVNFGYDGSVIDWEDGVNNDDLFDTMKRIRAELDKHDTSLFSNIDVCCDITPENVARIAPYVNSVNTMGYSDPIESDYNFYTSAGTPASKLIGGIEFGNWANTATRVREAAEFIRDNGMKGIETWELGGLKSSYAQAIQDVLGKD